ncbi:hypothetical protein GYMLUDRAFT_252197 [Collybiopsis luxurians FD-317 M1]|uniref:Uncharacterized protein n=1 Tax=Collybiopsis luxurians FD-317 M1 TaxID=944289 RepID=A0A0D0C0V4_9AGAR|nr:hypothetical protein GYMLUDRAFT_252197 [Collybiopsis luxurians FD-317 M1]
MAAGWNNALAWYRLKTQCVLPIDALEAPFSFIKLNPSVSTAATSSWSLVKSEYLPTFVDAASRADLVMKSSMKFSSAAITYNRFLSAIPCETTAVKVKGEIGRTVHAHSGVHANDPNFLQSFNKYEMDGDFTKDLFESSRASALFTTLAESHTCEQNARRNAVDKHPRTPPK